MLNFGNRNDDGKLLAAWDVCQSHNYYFSDRFVFRLSTITAARLSRRALGYRNLRLRHLSRVKCSATQFGYENMVSWGHATQRSQSLKRYRCLVRTARVWNCRLGFKTWDPTHHDVTPPPKKTQLQQVWLYAQVKISLTNNQMSNGKSFKISRDQTWLTRKKQKFSRERTKQKDISGIRKSFWC